MTSAELKHGAKLQEWAARIQDCRSSGLSVGKETQLVCHKFMTDNCDWQSLIFMRFG